MSKWQSDTNYYATLRSAEKVTNYLILVSSLDWLRRRKRPEAENSAQKLEEMYVGNTLLKQKPRLRVRNANLTGPDQTPSSTDPANNSNTPSRKANSLPSNNFKLNPSTTTTSQPAYESDLTRVASTDQAHRSDMEQVLYRAARLRRRRDRSKSNETITRRSKSENHQATECKFTPQKAVRIIRASDYQNTFSAFFRVFQSTSHRNYNPCLDPTRRTRKRIVARI